MGMVWGEDLQSLRHGDDLFDTDPGTSNLRMTTFARERLALIFCRNDYQGRMLVWILPPSASHFLLLR